MVVDSTGLIYWIPQFPGEYGPINIIASDGGEDEVEPAVQEMSILVTPFTDQIDYCLSLHSGANLKSFYALPEDNSIASVMSPLGDNVTGVITEGESSVQVNGDWYGSVLTVKPERGYWLLLTANTDTAYLCLEDAIPTDISLIYNLHAGANLIDRKSVV